MPANPFAIDITALQFLNWLVPASDVEPVRAVLQRSIMLRQKQDAPDPHLLDTLNPQQMQEARDIIAAPDKLKLRLADALSARRTDLGLLSPHGQLGGLTVPVTVISGENEPRNSVAGSKLASQGPASPCGMQAVCVASRAARHLVHGHGGDWDGTAAALAG